MQGWEGLRSIVAKAECKSWNDPYPCARSGSVTGKDKVVGFGWLVAGKAGLVDCFVGGFAVLELRESPASGRGVFFGILDHELDVGGWASHKGLFASEDFVVFFGRNIAPRQPGDDGAVGEWKRL